MEEKFPDALQAPTPAADPKTESGAKLCRGLFREQMQAPTRDDMLLDIKQAKFELIQTKQNFLAKFCSVKGSQTPTAYGCIAFKATAPKSHLNQRCLRPSLSTTKQRASSFSVKQLPIQRQA